MLLVHLHMHLNVCILLTFYGIQQGGESTRDEMCQTLLIYYPKADLTTCGTYPDTASAYRPFLRKHYGRYS